MAAPKRTAFQIERDRRDIADLYLQGWTQQRIADSINTDAARGYELTRQQIGYDLKRIQEAWRESALIDIDEAKARELAKVDRLEREYWDAWERSCEDVVTVRAMGKQPAKGEKGKPDRVTRITKKQDGDPAFLRGVQWCIERRCKIIGVDAPTKTEAKIDGAIKFEAVEIGGLDPNEDI